jgi:stage III sporulation protein AG
MDVSQNNFKQKAENLLRKLGAFKYALLILAVGVVLIGVPTKKTNDTPEPLPSQQDAPEDISEELEQIVERIHGAGKAKVMLTLECGPTNSYQTNSEIHDTEDGERRKLDTVLASSGSGAEEALVVGVAYPSYRGAVVICEGADSPSVRLSVIQAVSSLTGLTSDKIAVIKMSSD